MWMSTLTKLQICEVKTDKCKWEHNENQNYRW